MSIYSILKRASVSAAHTMHYCRVFFEDSYFSNKLPSAANWLQKNVCISTNVGSSPLTPKALLT